MKPPRFEYHRAGSVDEVVALLAEHADEAKVLAGGQSLVPLLSLRLARPAETLSLLEVVESIDGRLSLNACVEDPAACELADTCAVRAVWCEAQSDLVQHLARTTFRQLAHTPAAPPRAAKEPIL